ncbi:hypothetical protein ABG067_002779 [Albugo candida]
MDTCHSNARALPERISFPDEETKILAYWDKIDAFKKSLQLSKNRKPFTFFDGPPFATGLPHHGHILAGTIKDTVTRFAHQTGHHVERRFGWDCHGLPVESEINKKLNIKTKEQVLEMGIDKYNNECRGIVTRYTKEWEITVKRIGRWIDCENDYKTMEPWYMESVWNVFQKIFEKNLVYRGYKILPYSTTINTSLSNFEANLDYRDTSDPSVVVNFPLREDPSVAFVAWTTTPWTLPSNLALCVNVDFVYVKIKDVKSGKQYILCESRLCQLYPKMLKKGYNGGEYEILEKFKGSVLVGKKYIPLFDCFAEWDRAFVVVSDSYVTDTNGTGIVHQSPTFGEDDYRVCVKNNITDKFTLPDPLDDNGIFTDVVPLVKGLFLKDADDVICKDLKARDRLVSKGTIVHSYPFCYRSGTPLIYRAVPGWFVNVEAIRDRIVENNRKTYWVPAFVKEKRFHNWLVDGKDWNVSRGRFWGTPLPLWVSEDYEEVVCVGSISELEELSGEKVEDLHREYIDHITIPSRQGNGVLRRVPEVFDCWFESGSMPYAQLHYPFENQDKFEAGFPADFIAEGLDQTRGWFYTLMVISTALFDKPAFKNLIVNGLVLAEDGRKMSKSLRNFTDPTALIEQYGADALRLYLINSPVVRAEPLKFQEAGVKGVIRDLFLPWYNAARFFAQNAMRLEKVTNKVFTPTREEAFQSDNVMDSWIIAALHNLIKFVRDEMAAFRLYTVVPRLVEFIDQLTKWYVRLNRPRLKGTTGSKEAQTALSALYEVLYALSKLMAPFTPFLAEFMYQFLKKYHPMSSSTNLPEDAEGVASSVHFLMIPEYDPSRLDKEVERRMKMLQSVIEMGRVARERRTIPLKTPLRTFIVVCGDTTALKYLESLKAYIFDELNMRDLKFTDKEREWCDLKAEANSKALGKKMGKDFGRYRSVIKDLKQEDCKKYLAEKSIVLGEYELVEGDLIIKQEFVGDKDIYEAVVSSEGDLTVVLDCREDEDLKSQGYAREFITRVQKLRKQAGLDLQDGIHVYFQENGESSSITDAIKAFYSMIVGTLKTFPAPMSMMPTQAVTIISETVKYAGSELLLHVIRPAVLLSPDETLASAECVPAAWVRAYIDSMVYEHVEATLRESGNITICIKGQTIALQHHEHLFLNAAEYARVHLKDDVEYNWLTQSTLQN